MIAVSLREKLGYKILNSKLKKQVRHRQICNLDLAKTTGIIFNATNQASYDSAMRFANFLIKSKEIDVTAIGFVSNKDMLAFFSNKKGFNFFSRKDLNWYGRPKDHIIDEFVEKPFDILIDLSLDEHYPVQYIVALSQAKLKVGRFIEDNTFYDIMIDTAKDNTLENLVNQVELYLSILNVKQN